MNSKKWNGIAKKESLHSRLENVRSMKMKILFIQESKQWKFVIFRVVNVLRKSNHYERFVMVLIRHVESYLTKVGIDMGIDEKNIYNVTVQNGQAIIANDNSSVTATTNIGATANDIERLITAVRTKMDTLISDEDKEAASESLEVIEAEVISEKPKKSMIKTAIASLQAIKGTVEFGSAVAALIQFVGPILNNG